jgi:hypothetical protein
MLCVIYVPHAISGHIKAVLLSYAESKLYATSTPSTSSILLKSINLIPRFCQICVQKVDTDYGLYYCSRCDFVAHLDCAMDSRNREELKDEESTEQSVDSAAYEVKKHNVGKDGTKIATEIKHFSHEHDLKLSDEVQNNKICDGCVRAIHPPFYSCGKCSFFLHKS